MGDGKTTGDGKTNPFGGPGDGKMAGNDFTKNPAGATPGGPGADFVANPVGTGPTGATPIDFTKGGKSAQKSGEPEDLNPESTIKQSGQRVPLADVPTGSPRAPLIGVGSIGDGRKPFKGI